jgi:hypothetical protein
VLFTGFDTFYVKKGAVCKSKNPQTWEAIKTSAHKAIHFSIGNKQKITLCFAGQGVVVIFSHLFMAKYIHSPNKNHCICMSLAYAI